MSGSVAGSDVYEVVVTAHARQQAVKNVYYYRITAGAGTSNALTLSTAFATQIQPTVRAALSTIYDEQSIVTRKLDSDTDFDESVLTGTGAIAGEYMPLYVTAVIKLGRTDKTTGNGRKSYGPIVEAQQADGDLTASGQLDFDTLAALLDDDITQSGVTFRPVIVGGKRTLAGASVPEGQWKWNDVDTAKALTQLGTQNSRKRKRGV